ncbi:MAG: hbd2 [Candidatus Aminicenantes bacterium]|nr:hbd2 [Candidatus Aminicenantes bacterium]
MDIKTIGIVGAGTMGGGITQAAAASGFEVLVHDTAQEYLDRGLKVIDKSVSKLIEKGKITEDKGKILGRIKTTTALDDFKGVDFVVEAVFEDYEVKKKVLVALDKVLAPEIILTSNTSSISITRLAALTSRAGKFMGMHFMNPVPLMTLVELIKGIATTPETFAVVKGLAEKMGKVALMEGVGSVEAIDTVMKLGMNHPMGPLALADLIGNDVCLYIMEVLYEGFKDSKYRPCPLLKKYVDAGYLGRKSGRGFYNYQQK